MAPSLGLRTTTLAANSVARQASTGGRIVMASQMDRREAGQMVGFSFLWFSYEAVFPSPIYNFYSPGMKNVQEHTTVS
jgi:hypothetical protein